MKTLFPYLALTLALAPGLFAVPAYSQSAITGTVIGNDGRPVDAVSVTAVRADRSIAREASTDSSGTFRLAPLTPGTYSVSARKVGYRSAELPGVRVALDQTLNVSVTMTQAPRQLSTIQIVTSPTSIDATSPALVMRLEREYTALLPSARTASSLIALVPGARKDQLWGGAPGVTNNYQLDGVSMNHPGLGGDFLSLSVDWIERLDIRGLGAGAEHGNFQGGIINAVTKTGTNERRYSLRTNMESPALTASNFNIEEDGVEQAGRTEFGGEALGPILRDRLFYFVAGQYVGRALRSPNLITPAADFQSHEERQTDARAMAKLTWLPATGQRVDLFTGHTSIDIDRAGINGVDDPSAAFRVSRPTTFFGLSWNNSNSARHQGEIRIAGFTARDENLGYEGAGVPAVHPLLFGHQPHFQNAAFTERRIPRSLSATAEWRTRQQLWTEHNLVVGAEVSRGRWKDERIRNGGVTWRPYWTDTSSFVPADVTTWRNVASEWGGEMRLDSDVGSEAVFVQDQFSVFGDRLSVTPGIRVGHWSGFVRPQCEPPLGRAGCHRFEAVSAKGFDPRLGVAWDVTGRATLAFKAHWGRYHQGMHSLFFDRVEGANAYSNQRFYYDAPPLNTSRATFTPAERDTPGSGFGPYFSESILDASGRVDGYKQPFVDQAVFAIEKSIGASWKAELSYTNRRNGDIAGLMDRNLATNFLPITDISVDNRYVIGVIKDAYGQRLTLPQVYVPVNALQAYLAQLHFMRIFPPTIFGYDTAYISSRVWNPDIVLTSVPAAKRHFQQATFMLRTVQPNWRAEGSVTAAWLEGNTSGVAGFETTPVTPGITGLASTGTRFSAGQFVNPNEGVYAYGTLPDANELEAKLWVTARLPYSLQGGFFYTHILGEHFTPSFQFEGRYVYRDSALREIPDLLFDHTLGQTIMLDPRGNWHYGSRGILDTHLE
ncbi:MAG: TonB-dependent receptor, partial [Gemmatimonadaceae bacterium]